MARRNILNANKVKRNNDIQRMHRAMPTKDEEQGILLREYCPNLYDGMAVLPYKYRTAAQEYYVSTRSEYHCYDLCDVMMKAMEAVYEYTQAHKHDEDYETSIKHAFFDNTAKDLTPYNIYLKASTELEKANNAEKDWNTKTYIRADEKPFEACYRIYLIYRAEKEAVQATDVFEDSISTKKI